MIVFDQVIGEVISPSTPEPAPAQPTDTRAPAATPPPDPINVQLWRLHQRATRLRAD